MNGNAARLITYSLFLTIDPITSSSLISPLTKFTFSKLETYDSFPDDKLSSIVTFAPISESCFATSEPINPQPPVNKTSLSFKILVSA